jgi:hypothetical protein
MELVCVFQLQGVIECALSKFGLSLYGRTANAVKDAKQVPGVIC